MEHEKPGTMQMLTNRLASVASTLIYHCSWSGHDALKQLSYKNITVIKTVKERLFQECISWIHSLHFGTTHDGENTHAFIFLDMISMTLNLNI